ncbi:MAG: helix-turn-helix domain-containing protein [Isosphaeraceae bacterium]
MSRNPLWARIQRHMDETRYNPKAADLARETGVSEQVLSKWRAKPVMPETALLLAFSRGTGIPYGELLCAAMEGRGLVPHGTALALPAEEFLTWSDQVIAEFKAKESRIREVDFVRRGRKPELSEPAAKPDLAIAAHEDGDIAGETETRNDP